MSFLNKLPIEFPFPNKVQTVICCDLDETYIPFDSNNKSKGGVECLEGFMCSKGVENGMVLGWITGSSRNAIFHKVHNYINRSPSFICCSLSTEFYWIKFGELKSSKSWKQRIIKSGYDRYKVGEIIKSAKNKNIVLIKQPDNYQGHFKISYYYKINDNIESDFSWLKEEAANANCHIILTKSNPAVSDHSDYYDIEFIPTCCGKDEAVLFVMQKLGLDKKAIYSFGDSCNDFPMFLKSGNGYLVSNADPYAIALYGSCLEQAYCHGILSVLNRI
ncbi:HAD family hydrolase [Candidatus Enterovibrio escicola]|uniref:HAD family hydrolase n=1 Tax=Candidatus Enterovibrio escicola TaxID=1927127 RepID=UPI001238259E|nr:HAD family hydrolase [Candidatus Enterovibrio escacola]